MLVLMVYYTVVINYVDKVVMRTATEFEWYINLHGDAIKFMNEHVSKNG